jgi:hypothetical protein
VICRLGWPEIRGKERWEEEYKIKTSRVAVSDKLNETARQQRQWDREKQNNFPWRVTGKSKFTLTLYYYRQRAQSCARLWCLCERQKNVSRALRQTNFGGAQTSARIFIYF